jgi:hypothetical protein
MLTNIIEPLNIYQTTNKIHLQLDERTQLHEFLPDLTEEERGAVVSLRVVITDLIYHI